MRWLSWLVDCTTDHLPFWGILLSNPCEGNMLTIFRQHWTIASHNEATLKSIMQSLTMSRPILRQSLTILRQSLTILRQSLATLRQTWNNELADPWHTYQPQTTDHTSKLETNNAIPDKFKIFCDIEKLFMFELTEEPINVDCDSRTFKNKWGTCELLRYWPTTYNWPYKEGNRYPYRWRYWSNRWPNWGNRWTYRYADCDACTFKLINDELADH